MEKKIAVVTGGNKGIGFAACRLLAQNGFHVVLTARSIQNGKEAARKLESERLDVSFFHLEVTDEFHIQKLRENLEKGYGRCDVLVNNAAIFPDSKGPGDLHIPLEMIEETFRTNTLAPLRLSQVLIPLMKKHKYGRIINLSSGLGQLSDMKNRYAAYRISKTALNAVTRILAAETAGSGILVNSMCPGWVKTDMGGPDAERTPEQGADTILWLAALPADGPSGGFFRDRAPIPW
jgi:NAD(P)-dependent dehydrogenase (short-subunit alcohol dehydrogenase family)